MEQLEIWKPVSGNGWRMIEQKERLEWLRQPAEGE